MSENMVDELIKIPMRGEKHGFRWGTWVKRGKSKKKLLSFFINNLFAHANRELIKAHSNTILFTE